MSRTCGGDSSPSACNSNEIMLFGVRVRVDPMRKIVSMNNLSDYEQPPNHKDSTKPADDFAAGYTSADDAAVPRQHQSTRAAGKDRKRGVAWSEEEHKLFLIGLEKVGKGDWKGISRNFVKTRTPTQVASHAQKYFLRKNNLNRRRRRSSLFDITTASSDSSVTATLMEEEEEKKSHQDDTAAQIALPPTSLPSPPLQNSNINPFAVAPFPVTMGPILVPVQVHNPLANMTVCQGYNLNNKNNNTSSALLIHPVPVPVFPVNPSSAPTVLNLNQRVASVQSPLSWSLSLASHQNQSTTRHSSFNNGDSIVTVA